jgi:hypothetical protein
MDLGPKTYSKLLSQAIDILIVCFEKLFNNKVYNQKKAIDFSQSLAEMTKSLINSTYKSTSSEEDDPMVRLIILLLFSILKNQD